MARSLASAMPLTQAATWAAARRVPVRARAILAQILRCCGPSTSGAGSASARWRSQPRWRRRRTAGTARCSSGTGGGRGRRGDRLDRVVVEGPVGAAGPVLLLPDGRGFLERVDAVTGRLERLGAV